MRTAKYIAVVLLVLGTFSVTFAQPPLPEIPGATVIATGLTGPQGVLVDPDGNVWVVDSGMGGEDTVEVAGEDGTVQSLATGMTSRVTKVDADGNATDMAMLPSVFFPETEEFLGGARLALLDGTLYVTSGGWVGQPGDEVPPLSGTVLAVNGDELVEVANLWAYESANNPDGLIYESHPYGMVAGPDGWLWVADAGANTLLRVNPADGTVELVAAFDGLPGVFPNPNRNDAVEADPVPTAVVVDEMGGAYVALLTGAPFVPGSAKVLKVDADGAITDYATGLTMLTDLTQGPDGELYAIQFAVFSEEGPDPTSGAVIRVKEGAASEVVFSGLPFPTGIAFDADGNAFVTINGVGAPGSGAVIRVDGLTTMAGEPVPMMSEGAQG